MLSFLCLTNCVKYNLREFYTYLNWIPCFKNVPGTMYNILCYFRATLLASDRDSGVFKLEIILHVKTPGKAEYIIYQNYTKSARGVRLSIVFVAVGLAKILIFWTLLIFYANYCLNRMKAFKYVMYSTLSYALQNNFKKRTKHFSLIASLAM